jgi:hypothetical protein
MATYDVLLTLSTHHSNSAAIRFLNSLHYLGDGDRVLPILVAPEAQELADIANACPSVPAVYINQRNSSTGDAPGLRVGSEQQDNSALSLLLRR